MTVTIAILTGGHLCHNPRVVKEASALARAGYDVHILGGWFESALKARDQAMLAGMPVRFTPVIDLTSSRPGSWTQQLFLRGRAKAMRTIAGWTGLRSHFQLGLATNALYKAARKINARLYIAHMEPALPAALDLVRSGRRVGVDMEDWYSEDLLPEARKERPVAFLRNLEGKLLRKSAYATCPSRAMSEALRTNYGCVPPTVIHNSFSWADRNSLGPELRDRKDRRIPSIHWYSQTIGHGRGLEDLFAALPHLEHEVEVHLRGQPVAGFDAWLSARVPEAWRQRVFVHGLVPNEHLLSRIAEHDIGFAGEMKFCKSRELTITNKILHYLLAGLAVVASDTAGQREVAEQAPGALLLYASGDASALAMKLNTLLELPERLKHAKAASLRAAEQTFCWERQENVLLETVARVLGGSIT